MYNRYKPEKIRKKSKIKSLVNTVHSLLSGLSVILTLVAMIFFVKTFDISNLENIISPVLLFFAYVILYNARKKDVD